MKTTSADLKHYLGGPVHPGPGVHDNIAPGLAPQLPTAWAGQVGPPQATLQGLPG